MPPSFKRRRFASRPKRAPKRMSRGKRGRVVGRSMTKRGVKPTFLFHRWVTLPVYSSFTAAGGVNFDAAVCSYSATTGILGAGSTLSQTSWPVSCAFSFDQLPNVTEFTALFDQYKLNGVMFQIKMIPNPDAVNLPFNTSTVSAATFYPTIWYCTDYDDNNFISLSAIKEYERVKHKVLRPNQETNIFLKPTTLTQVYNTSVATGFAVNFKKPWLDCATGSIPHYGLKFVVDFEGLTSAGSVVQQFQFKINCKYYFGLKNVR